MESNLYMLMAMCHRGPRQDAGRERNVWSVKVEPGASIGRGQMGSALEGSLQFVYSLTEGLVWYSR